MENKKDLSRDFAIIFGIKPEEVPNNSSGNQDHFSTLSHQVFSRLVDLGFGNKPVKTCETKENLIKARSNELKRYSEMENSKSKHTSSLQGDTFKYEQYPQLDQALKKERQTETEELQDPEASEEKGKPQDRYQVIFNTNNLSPLYITESMFTCLVENINTSRLNGYQSTSNLLFALDEDTGEMICLDSSSILSITKVK